MQILFKEIIAGDIDAVRQRLTKHPGAVALVATPPPKQYAGQSPLQVAYRNGEFEIAGVLLEQGADPNFIEHDDREPWAMPVLHHAIKAAVMRSRWLRPTRFAPRDEEVWQFRNTAERADSAYAALQLLLAAGADVQALDSYGNSSLGRAVLDARQILPAHRYNEPDWVDPKPLNPTISPASSTHLWHTARIRTAMSETSASPWPSSIAPNRLANSSTRDNARRHTGIRYSS